MPIPSLGFMVLLEGLEPPCFSAVDFKPTAYAIPPQEHVVLKERLELSPLSGLVSKTRAYAIPPLEYMVGEVRFALTRPRRTTVLQTATAL